MTVSTASIGILEDDPYFRAHLEAVVAAADGLTCVFSVGTLEEALQAFKGVQPDLCLVDLALPDGRGLDLVVEASQQGATRILVLSVLGDRASVMTALRAGAHGYVLKDSRDDLLVDSIRQTLCGYAPISPEIAIYLTRLLASSGARSAAATGEEDEIILTSREEQLLSIFARGLSYREAADVLGVSPHTVSDFVKKIYRKLNVHSRSEAVFEARNLGLISLGESLATDQED